MNVDVWYASHGDHWRIATRLPMPEAPKEHEPLAGIVMLNGFCVFETKVGIDEWHTGDGEQIVDLWVLIEHAVSDDLPDFCEHLRLRLQNYTGEEVTVNNLGEIPE